jgi:serine/threonine protein kinase
MSGSVPAVIGGRYRLLELIGRGGMAEVWRGYDRRRETTVAIKIMNPLFGGMASAERFAREARAAAQIVHPNVVTILDVGQDDGRHFLVMELLSGHSLAAELAARGPLPVAAACGHLAQAAAGLDAAHRAGVVHRDIKPANLHLTGEGTVKVVDFGLAHLADDAARLTTVGTLVGTPAYLAPEQIDGSKGAASGDLYALGCVAYELLCGRPPFTGSPAELIYQHIHQPPAPLRAHRPDVPPELERLILAMLAKVSTARPASADQVRHIMTTFTMPAPSARGGDTALLDIPPGGVPSVAGPPAHASPSPGVVGAQRTPSVAGAWGEGSAHAGGWREGSFGARSWAQGSPPGAGVSLQGTSAQDGRPVRDRRLFLSVAGAVGAILVGTVVVVALSGDPGGSVASPPSAVPALAVPPAAEPQAGSTTATPTVRPTARAAATPDPLPTPAPGRTVNRDPLTWLGALQRAVNVQYSSGGIDRRVARKAHRKIRDAARKLHEGKPHEARKKIEDLARDLMEARREGRLAEGPLTSFLDRSGLT